MSFGLILFLIFSYFFFGCAGKKEKLEAKFTDKEIFQMGLEEFDKENYQKARMYFNRIESYFPQSSYIQQARLLRADSYFNEGRIASYIEAQAEYQTFLNLYPTADNLDYVQFQIAMCHHKQVRSPDRDISSTLKAFKEFKTFLEKYPNSKHIVEAEKKFQEVSDSLAEHEFQVGFFYFRRKRYLSAIDRFNFSLREYPSSFLDGKVHFYLGKSHLLLGNKKQAKAFLSQLAERFPKSEFALEAKEILSNMGDE